MLHIAYITMQMPIEENKDFSEFYELVYWKMILNKIKVIDNEEEVRISNSLFEWLKKETPEFRKNAHFKSGLALARVRVFRFFGSWDSKLFLINCFIL